MTLDARETAHFLLQRGMITPEQLLDGKFFLTDMSRRNCNYSIRCDDDAGFFIKQLHKSEAQAVESFNREASTYWLAKTDPDFAVLASLSPYCHGYDSELQVLVLELIEAAESLREIIHRGISPSEAAVIGQNLASVHNGVGRKLFSEGQPSPYTHKVPWTLGMHRFPASAMTEISEGNRQLIQTISAWPALCTLCEQVEASWQICAFIHGDLKPDNCLIYNADSGQLPACWFIDWELSDFGDPAWDVGTVLQGYWIPLLLSSAAANAQPDINLLLPLQSIMRATLDAYFLNGNSDAQYRNYQTHRILLFAAARLVQSAYEILYSSPVITNEAIFLLHTAVAIHSNSQQLMIMLGYSE